MNRARRRWLALVGIVVAVPTLAALPPPALPTDFDPARDPARDLDVALRIARTTGRRVLIVVGGEWSSRCHAFDRFFEANADLRRYRDANYVWLKVNWSPENTNRGFLGRFPPIEGYPHLIVLDAGGRLLRSQGMRELEAKDEYDPAAVHAFLVRWGPRR